MTATWTIVPDRYAEMLAYEKHLRERREEAWRKWQELAKQVEELYEEMFGEEV